MLISEDSARKNGARANLYHDAMGLIQYFIVRPYSHVADCERSIKLKHGAKQDIFTKIEVFHENENHKMICANLLSCIFATKTSQ